MSTNNTQKPIDMNSPLKDGIKEMLSQALESGGGYGWKDSTLELSDGTKITFDLDVRVKSIHTA
jgi:hypothetical protein